MFSFCFSYLYCLPHSQGHLLPVGEITCLAQIVSNHEELGTVKDTSFAGTLMVKAESADHLYTVAVVGTKIISRLNWNVARLAVMQVFRTWKLHLANLSGVIRRLNGGEHTKEISPLFRVFAVLGFKT